MLNLPCRQMERKPPMRSSEATRRVGLVLLAVFGVAVAARAALPDDVRLQVQAREARLQAMTPDQRSSFLLRVAAWDALPRHEREERRARYLAWRELDESERNALRALAVEVASFPPERQQALREEFAALDASQRHGWRLGRALGADYMKLHPLLAYVPAEHRLPLLAMLRDMDMQQRADLAVLAQRTPPQDRDALRTELLAIPGPQRAAWLQQQLDR
jgi:hypothetical protein